MNISYDYITDYICKTLPESTGLLKEMENFAKAHYVPIIQKETMHFLKFLMSVIKPEKILEIGTAIGYSSLVFSQFLKEGGKIITVELDEDMAKIALENFKKAQNKSIKLIIGDGGDVLLNTNEKFDVVFLDANKSLYLHSLPDIKRILKKGGVLIADNVLYKGMVASGELETFRKKTLVKNLRDFLYEISNDGCFTTSILPIGDGISVSYYNN